MPRKCKGSFKMKYNNATFPFKGEGHDFVHEGGYKIVRKNLEDGIQGEAENGKIINIDVSIPKGSKNAGLKMKHGSAMKGYKSDAQRKAVHASKAERSGMKNYKKGYYGA